MHGIGDCCSGFYWEKVNEVVLSAVSKTERSESQIELEPLVVSFVDKKKYLSV